MLRSFFLWLLISCTSVSAATINTSGDLTPNHLERSFTIRAYSNQTHPDPVEQFTISGAPDWLTHFDGSELNGTYDIDGGYSGGFSRSKFIPVRIAKNWKPNDVTNEREDTFVAGGESITITQAGIDNTYVVTTDTRPVSHLGKRSKTITVTSKVSGSPVFFPSSTGENWIRLQSVSNGYSGPIFINNDGSAPDPTPAIPASITTRRSSGGGYVAYFTYYFEPNWEPNAVTNPFTIGTDPFIFKGSPSDAHPRLPKPARSSYPAFSGFTQEGIDNTYVVTTDTRPVSHLGKRSKTITVTSKVSGSPVFFPSSTGENWIRLQSVSNGYSGPIFINNDGSAPDPTPAIPASITTRRSSGGGYVAYFTYYFEPNWEPNAVTNPFTIGTDPFIFKGSPSDAHPRLPKPARSSYPAFSGFTQEGIDNTYIITAYNTPSNSHLGGTRTVRVSSAVSGSPVFYPQPTPESWIRLRSIKYAYSSTSTFLQGNGQPLDPPVTPTGQTTTSDSNSGRYRVTFNYHVEPNWKPNANTNDRDILLSYGGTDSDDNAKELTLTQNGLDNTYVVTFTPESGSYLGGTLSATIYGEIRNEEFPYSSQAPWLTTDPNPGTGTLSIYAGSSAPRRYKATIPFTYPENYDFAAFTPAREGSVSIGANPVTFTQESSGFEILSARQEDDNEETARWVTLRYNMGEQRDANTVILSVKRDGDDTFLPVHESKFSPSLTPITPGSDLTLRWDASGFAETLSEEDRIILKISDSLGFHAESDPFKLEPNCGACLSCDSLAGNSTFTLGENGAPSMSLPLGANTDGTSGGTLYFDNSTWEEIGTPAALRSQLFGSATALPAPSTLTPEPEPTQYRTDNALVDIVTPATPDGTWQLRYYDAATSLGTFDTATGTHDQSSATPYHTISFTRAPRTAPSDPITLTISESGDLGTRTNHFSNSSGRWSHSVSATPTDPPLRTETTATSISGGSGLVLHKQITDRQILDASSTLISRTETTRGLFLNSGYKTISERRHLIAADGTPQGIRTTTWEYDENRFSPTYGRLLARTTDFDQSSTHYTYDAQARLSTITRPHIDATVEDPAPEVTTITYQEGAYGLGSATDRAEIRTISQAGTITARTFTIRFGDQLTAPYIQGGGTYTYTERWDITATDLQIDTIAEALTGTGTLTTKSRTYVGIDTATRRDQFTTRSTLRPDGTITISENTTDASHTWTGSAASSGNSITEGTYTSSLKNSFGTTITTQTFALPSDLLIASQTAITQDTFGRVTESESLGGLRTTRTYNCCGLESETDASGITTTYSYDALRRLTSTTRTGITSTTVPDPLGRVVSAIITGTTASGETANLTTSATQDSLGLTTTSTDPLGRITSSTSSTDPTTGRTTTTSTYPDGGTRIQERHPDGRIYQITGTAVSPWLRHTYDFGDLPDGTTLPRTTTTILDPATGAPTDQYTIAYTDSAGRIVRTELPPLATSGVIPATTASYNALGQLTAAIDPDGITTLYEYDTLGRRTTTAIDANSNGTIDLAGPDRITRTTYQIGTYQGHTVSTTHTAIWKDASTTTPFTLTTAHTTVDGLQSWTINYPGTPYEAIDHTTVSIDATARTRTVTTTLATGSVTTRTYIEGRLTAETAHSSTGDLVASTTLTYDALGRPATRTNAGGATTTTSYDLLGRPTTVTLSATGIPNQTTTYAYTDHSTSSPTGPGTAITTTLPDGLTTTTLRDPAGRTLTTTGARTTPAAYTYTPAGQVSTLTTAPGTPQAATTAWLYNSQGRLTEKYYDVPAPPAAITGTPAISYAHSPAGRTLQRTDARGNTTAYQYAPHTADLTSITYSAPTGNTAPTTDVTFTAHTRFGAPTTITDALGTRSLGIHPTLPRLNSEPGALGYTALSTFSGPTARRTLLEITAPTGQPALPQSTTGYTYESAGRIGTINFGTGNSTTYSYSPHTPRPLETSTQTTSANLRTLDSIDPLGRTTARSLLLGTQETNGTYTYNNANQIIAAPDLSRLGNHWVYTYDDLGQLTNATLKDPTGTAIPGSTHTYTHDATGNRLENTTDGEAATYTPNTSNQYTSATPAHTASIYFGTTSAATSATANGTPATSIDSGTFHAQIPITSPWEEITLTASDASGTTATLAPGHLLTPGSQPITPTYDADGNLLTDGRFTYTWDAENRLATATTSPPATSAGAPQLQLTFTYDYRSRRTTKQVTENGTPTTITHFLYDNTRIIAELQTPASAPTTLTTARTYSWGIDLSGTIGSAGDTGGLLALHHTTYATNPTGDTTTYLPATDHNGNITTWQHGTTNTPAAQLSYSPFGKTTTARYQTPEAKAHLSQSGFAFSTRYQDTETGLYDYGFRHYHPELGRWLSRDPIQENGGLNLYGFVGNDPVNGIDVLGLALYSFDGTWNDRSEMVGFETNVARLHRVYDGKNARYLSGPGTSFSSPQYLGGGFGIGGQGIIREMWKSLLEFQKKGDCTIDIIGFSRGAAIAREFANKVKREGKGKVRFLGLFDTVGSFGIPGNRIDPGYDLSVDPNHVQSTFHATASGERRRFFPLASVRQSPDDTHPRIVEQGFEGAHSDIGGGYENYSEQDLSDATLVWMHQKGRSVGVPFGPLSNAERVVSNRTPHDSGGTGPRNVFFYPVDPTPATPPRTTGNGLPRGHPRAR